MTNTPADTHIALLRGINVGGRNKLPMKSLAAIFAGAGCASVKTYIQSGNVVFQAEPALAARIPQLVAKAVSEQFGFEPPVITRTDDELGRVIANNPFLQAGAEERALHVGFLADLPDADRVAALDPQRSPPDEFAVVGREIYSHCPNGLARTKLSNAYFDSKLETTSTFRNWRTTLKLLELAGQL